MCLSSSTGLHLIGSIFQPINYSTPYPPPSNFFYFPTESTISSKAFISSSSISQKRAICHFSVPLDHPAFPSSVSPLLFITLLPSFHSLHLHISPKISSLHRSILLSFILITLSPSSLLTFSLHQSWLRRPSPWVCIQSDYTLG